METYYLSTMLVVLTIILALKTNDSSTVLSIEFSKAGENHLSSLSCSKV